MRIKSKSLSIGRKMALLIILVITFTSVSISLFSYITYRNDLISLKGETARAIAEATAAGINIEQFMNIVESNTKTPYYERLKKEFDIARERIGFSYLYIMTKADELNYKYIVASNDTNKVEIFFGDTDLINLYEIEVLFAIENGESIATKIWDGGRYGVLVSGFAPILDENGKTCGIVGADINVDDIVVISNSFRNGIFITLLLISLMSLPISIMYLRRTIMKPIEHITDFKSVLQNLVNGLDACLFVTDIDTNEVLFLNDRMKDQFHIEGDVVGESCDKSIGPCMEHVCEFCAKKIMDREDISAVLEEQVSVGGSFYKKVDSTIEWLDKRMVHLQYYVDITEMKQAEESLERRLDQQAVLGSISQSFITNNDTDLLMNNALQMTGEIMGADRIVLAELDKKEGILQFRYELSNGKLNKQNKQNDRIVFSPNTYLYDTMLKNNFFTIAIDEVNETDYEDAKERGVMSALILPVFTLGELWGILEFDRSEHYKWTGDDKYAGNLICNVLSGAITRQSAEGRMSVISDFFRIIRNPIFEMDKDKTFTTAYSEEFTFAGYSIQELQSKNLIELLVPKDTERISDIMQSAITESKHNKTIGCQVIGKSGELLDYELDILPIFDSYGAFSVFRASYTDITEKKKSERELLLMSALINSSPQYISYITQTGEFRFFNPATYEVTGYSYDELMSGGVPMLYDDDTNRYIADDVIPKVNELGKYEYEIPLIRKDGEERIMSFSSFTIGDEMDHGCIATDVTEKRQLEKDLIQAKEAAEQASKSKSEFLSRMSHEIRTPMNAIIGMTSIAQSSSDPEKKEYCLDKISGASKLLLGVINDILDMAKIEADKFELSYSEFNIEETVMNIITMINFRSEEKQQTINVMIDKDVPKSIIGDELRLSQVISNLLSNAVKFTPNNGIISISVKNTDLQDNICTLLFMVEDNGIGISPSQQARLFTSFEQADGSVARLYGGTGLGLAITKRIVELMNGRIWIESELGMGSKFFFTIKVKLGTSKTSDGAVKTAKKVSSGIENDFRKYTVLLAEDVEINREIISAILEDTGITIDYAVNGVEAFDLLRKRPGRYNLILMDIHMPEMDGYETTRAIRALDSPEFKNIPIIAMTANVFTEDIQKCLATGMNDHIGKPIDKDELLIKLAKYLHHAENLPIHHIGNIHSEQKSADAAVPDYSGFLPVIDVEAGLHRLMNNKNLYFNLLRNFKGKQMTDELQECITSLDHASAAQISHALKGVSLNLGLNELASLAQKIESHAKAEMSAEQLVVQLKETADNAVRAIEELLSSENTGGR